MANYFDTVSIDFTASELVDLSAALKRELALYERHSMPNCAHAIEKLLNRINDAIRVEFTATAAIWLDGASA